LQLVAAMAPPEAPAPLSVPAAANSLPFNSGLAPDSTAPAPLIAFHSTAELNIRGVLFSSIASDPASQAAVSSPAAPEIPAAPVVNAPVRNAPASDAKTQEKIAPVLQDAAPAIEEAPILASAPSQKASEPKTAAPAPEAHLEHKSHARPEKEEPTGADVPGSQPKPAPTVQPQPQITVPATTALPLHMVLPVSARPGQPLTPLGNRIPAATRTPVRTETPADPFYTDADRDPKQAATLPAEATKPLVATADQLAFAAKVQLAKPQPISQHGSQSTTAPRHAEPVQSEPVHSEQHSQHGNHRDSDPQFSMKQGEAAARPAVRPAHAASTFEAVATGAEKSIPATRPSLTASARPTAAAAAVEDITPTRPEVPAAPMKDISVRIQSEQGENVDVRILHRAGDVQIAVKSASGETTQGLRHGLSELSDRLNASGYHADTWHPGQAAAVDNAADSGGSQYSQQHHSQQQSQGDSQSNSGWSQQQGGRRDDNQPNRPRWIEELESNISSSPETGLFHGLIR
jgi:hypothetical protein